MRSILFTIFFSALLSPVFALECEHMARATTTDQKNMAFDIAFKFLQYSPEEIISMQTTEYVSWKSNQIGCLADVSHYAKVIVVKKDGPGKRCATELDLYAKDFFVAQINYIRDYKPRNTKTICYEESESEMASRNKCEQMTACPRQRDGLLYRDITANCECRPLYNMVKFDEVSERYEGFYNPKKEFSKPADIEDLF
ncbi:MAG: hypothetical protein K9K67_14775 [Bacteriovoracaceae bacterium]|nr:hypothetical protein [Bacteriovoracaceae bacterium]